VFIVQSVRIECSAETSFNLLPQIFPCTKHGPTGKPLVVSHDNNSHESHISFMQLLCMSDVDTIKCCVTICFVISVA